MIARALLFAAAERAEDIRERTGVDPSALYARASRARYASEAPDPGEAAAVHVGKPDHVGEDSSAGLFEMLRRLEPSSLEMKMSVSPRGVLRA